MTPCNSCCSGRCILTQDNDTNDSASKRIGILVTPSGFKVRFQESTGHKMSNKIYMNYRRQIKTIIVFLEFLEKEDQLREYFRVGVREISKEDLADKTMYCFEGNF